MKAKEVFLHALSLVGTPYFYGAKNFVLTEAFMQQMHKQYPKTVTLSYMAKARRKKMIGRKCIDCSGVFTDATGIQWGSSQMYSRAQKRLSVKEYQKWADGVIVWRSGHVGVFGWLNGKPVVVEAKGIDYGTVISDFKPSQWSYGLTFDFLQYEYAQEVVNKTSKQANPYNEPKIIVTSKAQARKKKVTQYACNGNDAFWVQFELKEAGYDIAVDGDFGPKSLKALIDFQKSSKLTQDGLCGANTRKALKG